MCMRKVKYGAHCFLWIEQWSNAHLSLIGQAASLGLDCLEIAVGDDVEFEARAVKSEAERNKVEIVVSPGGVWPMEADISHDDKAARAFGLKWHKEWIARGAEAGATAYTGALYAHPGRVERRAPSADEFAYACENLYDLAEYAHKQGVVIVLEPMSHFRTHLVNTGEQVMRLIGQTGHDNLKVLLDTYHLITEVRNFAHEVGKMASRLWGVHACENDRGVPGGGLVPWLSLFDALKLADFDGYMILETYNSSLRNGNFAFSRGMFHNVCLDGDAFTHQGLTFLRKMWEES